MTLYGIPRDPGAIPQSDISGPGRDNAPSGTAGATAGWRTYLRRRHVAVSAATVISVGALALSVLIGGALGGAGAVNAAWHPRPAASAAPTPAPTSAAVDDTITLSGVGDVIMGSAPGDLPPHQGSGFFDQVTGVLRADLVMGNLETPLTEDTGRVKCPLTTPSPSPGNPSPSPTRDPGCHQFYLPPSYAKHLREGGFDLLNLANNHTNDMGRTGLRNTRAALESVGIRHTGAPGQITLVEVKGVKVAVLGFSVYGWTQNLNDIAGSARLVRKAAAQADLVVVQMQGGAEGADKAHVKPGHEIFLGEDRGDLIKFTHAMIDAGADVVFGHGPHIMRGMEFYHGRLIAYSLGNFCGYRVLSARGYLGVGAVLRVSLHRDGTWAGGTLVGTHMVNGGYPAPDPARKAIAFVAGLSRDDFGGRAARIATDGTITPPTS